jgi:MinD superfamily P-loop ATPase
MIISVASGKGGTGKTTVSVNLAASLETPLKLLDCDVEEPNVHLFIHPEKMISRKESTFVPEIDDERCNGCKKCADLCEFNALTVIGEKVLVFPELCHSCEGCREICPEQAVLPGYRELGTIETGSWNHVTLSYGRLRVGEAMSPPLIARVQSLIEPDDLVIIDAPPGTSCPAINAMKVSDFVLLVTEPTPFGLHDLVLTVEAVRQLKIPCGLVINRADIGNDEVYRYARRESLPILMEIRFDRTIAEIYSRGGLLVEHADEWRIRFRRLFDSIQEMAALQEVIR